LALRWGFVGGHCNRYCFDFAEGIDSVWAWDLREVICLAGGCRSDLFTPRSGDAAIYSNP
jgi:hypothetical protein